MGSLRASWLIFVGWPAIAGCESVPDLTFADTDGPADAAAVEAATMSDAPSDTDIDHDGAEGGGCTGTPPGGSDVCCTGTWCGGSCSQADCTNCLSTCGANKVCCRLNNNLMCRNVGQACP
jgi:hypothetical protein